MHVVKLLSDTAQSVNNRSTLEAALYYKLAKYYSLVKVDFKMALKYAQHASNNYYELQPNSFNFATALEVIGNIYENLGNLEKSLEYAEKSLKVIRNIINTSNQHNCLEAKKFLAWALNNVAWIYYKLGNYSNALKHVKLSVALYKEIYPNDGDIAVIYTLHTLGVSLIQNNSIEEGLKVLNRTLSLIEQNNIDNNFIVSFILYDLARAYLRINNYQYALQYSLKSLHIRRFLYQDAKIHIDIADSLCLLADVYAALENHSKALSLYKEALDMFIKTDLKDHYYIEEINRKIAKISQ